MPDDPGMRERARKLAHKIRTMDQGYVTLDEATDHVFKEFRKAKRLLWHAAYRSHPHSPQSCSPCDEIEKALSEDSLSEIVKPAKEEA